MLSSEDMTVLVHSRKREVSISKDHMYSMDLVHNISGTNFFSQVPQSTIFGVGDKITASGSADEAFVPATVISTVLFDISGTGSDSRSVDTF